MVYDHASSIGTRVESLIFTSVTPVLPFRIAASVPWWPCLKVSVAYFNDFGGLCRVPHKRITCFCDNMCDCVAYCCIRTNPTLFRPSCSRENTKTLTEACIYNPPIPNPKTSNQLQNHNSLTWISPASNEKSIPVQLKLDLHLAVSRTRSPHGWVPCLQAASSLIEIWTHGYLFSICKISRKFSCVLHPPVYFYMRSCIRPSPFKLFNSSMQRYMLTR